MMQVIRDKAQGIVAWVIVGIVAFVLCFWGVSGYISDGSNPVLAKVNGHVITAAEVDDIYNRWLRFNSSQPGFDPSKVNADMVKQQIVMSLAQQAGFLNSLRRDGLQVSEAMVLETIKNKAEFQKDGKFSIEAYKQLLAQLDIPESEFERLVRDELLVNQIQLAILMSSFSTQQQTEQAIALRNQKRNFGYTVIPVSKYLNTAKVDDAAVENYYQQHKLDFVVPEKVQLEYVELSLDDVMRNLSVSDEKLREYYQANIQSFSEPKLVHVRHIMITATKDSAADKDGSALKEIDAVYAKLQQGASFTDLAKEYSEDKESAVKGGDLGWVNKNDDYPTEVFSLQNKGDYTNPVQSNYGWHIFQLVDSKGGNAKSFAAVKDTVMQRYKREMAETLFSKQGDEMATLAFENPTSLAAVSDKLNLPIKTTGYFTKDGDAGIAESPNVLKAAFSDDVFKEKHNSDLVRLNDDTYVVLRIKDIQPAHEQSIETVQPQIRKILQIAAAKEQAKSVGNELITAIKETNNPNRVVSGKGLQWNVKNNVERDSQNVERAVLRGAFSIPKPAAGEPYTISGFSLANGDYVVVALTSVQNGTVEKNEDSNLLETVGQQIATMEGKLEFSVLQQALIERAKIKYML